MHRSVKSLYLQAEGKLERQEIGIEHFFAVGQTGLAIQVQGGAGTAFHIHADHHFGLRCGVKETIPPIFITAAASKG